MPLLDSVAAVSCGTLNNLAILDLDYSEDSIADVDANFVITGNGLLVEIQATAESNPFSENMFDQLLVLARKGASTLCKIQTNVLQKD